ncbi:MAG: DUF86 domain-containing protein [Bacteroidales bacterium]|nr:DUF86 domain-containing protein [Bacteroidales bacterium]
MDREILKYLYDMQECINNIDRYIGQEKVYAEYERNSMLQDAVERNIATIGEAMNKALKLDANLKISFARRIVGTRNRLIHGHDDIDNIEIWNIIVNNLPILKTEIETMLSEME